MMIGAAPMIVIGVATLFVPLQTRPAWALLLGLAPLAFVLIPVFSTWQFARRYADNH